MHLACENSFTREAGAVQTRTTRLLWAFRSSTHAFWGFYAIFLALHNSVSFCFIG